MNLINYASKHKAEICDWSATWNADAAGRGWCCYAIFSDPDDCEPDMLLVKSPSWPHYQVRSIAADISSGTMLSEKQVKNWIKAQGVIRRAH